MSPKVRIALCSSGDLQDVVNRLRLNMREIWELNEYLSLTNTSLSVVG